MTASFWHKRLACILLILAVGLSVSVRAEDQLIERFAKAVSGGDLESVNEMLDAGLDPNRRVPSSRLDYTPLFLAVQANQTAVTEALLKAGADPTLEDGNGDPVMIHATHEERKAQARLLIQHGVSIDSRNRSGITALMRGAPNDDAADIQAKIDLGADPELINPEGFTALMLATRSANIAAMEVLLKEGAKPNATNKEGKTALMMAIDPDGIPDDERIPEMVKLLIKHGADPNFTDPKGANALTLAIDSYRCPPEAINAILDASPDVNHRDEDGRDALFKTMLHDRTRGLTTRLLELGADLKTTDNDHANLLMLAAAGNDPAQVRFLLDHGLSPDRKTKSGAMAVHYALRAGRWQSSTSVVKSIENKTVEILKLLHGQGASLTAPDQEGDTPLHLAAFSNQANVFAYLLPFYEHPDVKNHLGETPLHLAATPSGDIVDQLLPKIPEPDVRDEAGRTAFMNANGYEAVQLSLLKAGADIDAVDKTGSSALEEAISDNRPEWIRFLIGKGADPKKLRDSDSHFLRVSRRYQDELIKKDDYATLVEMLAGIANDINARDADKMTALMWVAASNCESALQAVLEHKPDLDLRSPDGRTAMMWAACSRAEPAMELLRKAGADASLRDLSGRTADEWLAWTKKPTPSIPPEAGDDNLLLESLTVGRKTALLDYFKQHAKWSKDDRVTGMPPLHLAAALGDVNAIKELFKRGATLNLLSDDHSTPLMTAAANGESDTVQLLLDQGADPTLRDIHDKRAIDLAVGLRHPATARLFLHRENPFSPDESALLATLVWTGDEALLKDFLKSGASIPPVEKPSANCDPYDRNRPKPEAPLVAAAMQADPKMLKILAEFPKATGADNPDLLAIALHIAAENGRLGNVKFLIEECDADINSMLEDSFGGVTTYGSNDDEATKAVEGFTALSRALEEGHLGLVRYLVEKGAMITGRTRGGDPPLTFLIRHHQLDLLEFLLVNKAPTNLFDISGLTALHVAAAGNDEVATRLLLEHGADPDTRNPKGVTPLEMAQKNNATKTTALLESRAK